MERETRYKVLLTTSGTGSRLKELTKNLNKALVPLNGKPAVTYIINLYPEDTDFVVTVGYLGEQVREALPRLYPHRKFTFVEVDLYEGPGSSLGYSMLKAAPYLQCPFIFHACDTLVFGNTIPTPERHWMAGYCMAGDLSQYRTIEMNAEGKAILINAKGAGTSDSVFIGLFGIKEYALYWQSLQAAYDTDPLDQTLNDTVPVSAMLQAGVPFDLVSFPIWLDTGNPEALAKTQDYLREKYAKE